MENLNIKFQREYEPNFTWLSDGFIDFIKYLDFKDFEESDCIHNKVELLMLNIKNNVRFIRTSKNNIEIINNLLKELEEFIIWFFLQIYQKTSTHIVVCKWKTRIISNEAFKSFTGRDANDDPEILYEKSELQKIGLYVDALLSGKVVGYKEIFSTKKWNIAWTTLKLPYNDGINIRLGFNVWENENYKQFYSRWWIQNIHFCEENFYFSKQIALTFKKMLEYKTVLSTQKNDLEKFLNHIKVLALILDYLIIFSPNPLSFYRGKEPLIFSESYCKITWYSKEELFEYYSENGELTSLLYKGEDLEKVNEFVKKANESGNVGSGYDGVFFTLTTKSGKRINIPWTNHIYFDKNRKDEKNLSLRSWDLGQIEILN